jgi:two-component system, LytTR family, sensor kinase
MLINKTQRILVENKGPILYLAVFLIFSVGIISWLANIEAQHVSKGEWNVAEADFNIEKSYTLNGEWEFYWDKLLKPDNFTDDTMIAMDGYMKVPGSWSDTQVGEKTFPAHGLATYRMHIKIPSTMDDPAIKIKRVSRSVAVYANDQLIAEVGKV